MSSSRRLLQLSRILVKNSSVTACARAPAYRTLCHPNNKSETLSCHRSGVHSLATNASAIESLRVKANCISFHYEMTGHGEHNVMLLPGALGCSKTDFGPQLEKMNKEKFTIYAFDPRGYGQTIPPERDFPLKFLHRDADDVAAVMEELSDRPFSVLGWSDGGITAMILASRYPKLVRKMVIWGSNAYISDKDMQLVKGVSDLSSWSPRMRAPFVSVYGEEYFKKQWKHWIAAYEAYFTKRGGNICKEELKDIDCPTLILHGDKDPMVSSEHPDHLHKHIRQSRLHRFPEGKHNIHMRYADEFNKIVEDFLQG